MLRASLENEMNHYKFVFKLGTCKVHCGNAINFSWSLSFRVLKNAIPTYTFAQLLKISDDVVSQTLARWLAYFHFLEAKKMILSKSYAFLSKDVKTD